MNDLMLLRFLTGVIGSVVVAVFFAMAWKVGRMAGKGSKRTAATDLSQRKQSALESGRGMTIRNPSFTPGWPIEQCIDDPEAIIMAFASNSDLPDTSGTEPAGSSPDTPSSGADKSVQALVDLDTCEGSDPCSHDHTCRIHKIRALLYSAATPTETSELTIELSKSLGALPAELRPFFLAHFRAIENGAVARVELLNIALASLRIARAVDAMDRKPPR